MAPRIIETFRKDQKFRPGYGYGRDVSTSNEPVWVATRAKPLSSEIVHSTNNSKPTTIEGEAKFLRDSALVSCHDLIAKNGDVYIILPENYVAWHSGRVKAGFSNFDSFGTELHISKHEEPTAAQLESLAYRIKQRRERYGVPMDRIDTHREVALPKGRKSDPEGFDDEEFYAWRHGLFLATTQHWFKVRYRIGANVRTEKRSGAPKAFNDTLVLPQGDVFAGEIETGTPWGGDDRWVHLLDQRGFVHMSAVEEV